MAPTPPCGAEKVKVGLDVGLGGGGMKLSFEVVCGGPGGHGAETPLAVGVTDVGLGAGGVDSGFAVACWGPEVHGAEIP